MAISIIRNVLNKVAHSQSRASASTGPLGLVPLELLDLIISFLADDETTLLLCALVHPSWTSISRYHLRVTLVVWTPSLSKKLSKLLRSQRETLSPSIKDIELVSGVWCNYSALNSKSSRARSYRKLFEILKAKHVPLLSGTVANDPALLGLFAHYFPALTELKVTCISDQDITRFARALAGAFPRLSKLSIELGPGFPRAPQSGLRDLALGMPCLRFLRVVGWNNDFMEWLGVNVLGTLERLELERPQVPQWSACRVEAVYLLLQRNKETLRYLNLNFLYPDEVFLLSGLMRLQRFEITGLMSTSLEGLLRPQPLERILIREASCTTIPYADSIEICVDPPEKFVLLEWHC